MFRDTSTTETATTFWQAPEPRVAIGRTQAAAVFAEDDMGAVRHVYREIARRIASNAYTRHASTLGETLR
ncbi:MAG TPA: hypothetical protein VGO25_03600 [Rhodanobacteraceae bacterium]|jgi:hypothetical protein|nr:hypothetical protein [Rhodanobacteraceae bacterium]